MNNGVKAEKENTPNEANLQEEEVLRGSVRWPVRAGTAGGARVPGRRRPGGGNAPDGGPGKGASAEGVLSWVRA